MGRLLLQPTDNFEFRKGMWAAFCSSANNVSPRAERDLLICFASVSRCPSDREILVRSEPARSITWSVEGWKAPLGESLAPTSGAPLLAIRTVCGRFVLSRRGRSHVVLFHQTKKSKKIFRDRVRSMRIITSHKSKDGNRGEKRTCWTCPMVLLGSPGGLLLQSR